MKKFISILLASALLIISFSSCTKQLEVVPNAPVATTPTSTSAATLAEMNASENFDWSTTKKVNFTFNGTDSESYSLILKVMDADGNLLVQKMQKSDETYHVVLNVPAHYSTLFVTYGATPENFDCSTGSVTMNVN